MTHRLAVLISGTGSNLQAIIDAIANRQLDARIALVISNKPGVAGLDKAAAAGIPTAVFRHLDYPDRETFDRAMARALDAVSPDTVVLAGFMRILSPWFVKRYEGRLVNIHPSLLPRYPGLNTHQRALDAGDKEHGCSIHFVNDDLDGGPIIAQYRISVDANDSERTLSERVQTAEHQLYPKVLQWRAEARLLLSATGVILDDAPLPPTGRLFPQT